VTAPLVLLLKTAIMPEFALRPIAWRGLTLVIENEAGSLRSGPKPDGTTWETVMPFAYGYAKDSEGVDGDEVDIYVGPDLDAAGYVYIVHQRRAGDWERYDEDKCMCGFASEEAARAAFLACYDDPRFLGPITCMPVDEFVRKVKATRKKPAMIKAFLLRPPAG
jgi:hypothetical protein